MNKLQSWAIAIIILSAYSVAGEMDYQDAVAQHAKNCESAIYINDNNLDCGEYNE